MEYITIIAGSLTMPDLSKLFDNAVKSACNKGLIVAANLGSPVLTGLFFGKTSFQTNSEAIVIAAEKKHYSVTGMMLNKDADAILGPYDFALGKSWNRFEELAKTDPVIDHQLADRNKRTNAAVDRHFPANDFL